MLWKKKKDEEVISLKEVRFVYIWIIWLYGKWVVDISCQARIFNLLCLKSRSHFLFSFENVNLPSPGALSSRWSSLSCILNLSSLLGPCWQHLHLYHSLLKTSEQINTTYVDLEFFPVFPLQPNTKLCSICLIFHLLFTSQPHWSLTTQIIPFRGHQIPPYSHVAKSLGYCPPREFWFYFL